jgi:hypothetical protein
MEWGRQTSAGSDERRGIRSPRVPGAPDVPADPRPGAAPRSAGRDPVAGSRLRRRSRLIVDGLRFTSTARAGTSSRSPQSAIRVPFHSRQQHAGLACQA